MDEIEKLYQEQADFTANILNGFGLDLANIEEKDKVKWTKEYVLSIVKELTEILDNLDWKPHRKQQNEILSTANILEEFVDVQKFVWGLMALWGIDYDAFSDAYEKKSWVVRERLRQERTTLKKPIMFIDLDGVLCKYPDSFFQWCDKHLPNLKHLDKKKNPIAWEEAKHQYRLNGGKQEALVEENAVDFLKRMKEKGWSIAIYTYRPVTLYKNIEYDTLFWLNEHKMLYDKIIWASREKSFYINSGKATCDVFVDDDKETCLSVSCIPGIRVFCKNESRNEMSSFGDLVELEKKIG